MANAQTLTHNQLQFERVKNAYDEKWTSLREVLSKFSIGHSPLMLINAYKAEKTLEVWMKNPGDKFYRLIKVYEFCASSGLLGPKVIEGDKQTPEGFYYINVLNPMSNYHLSLGINYPNHVDIERTGKQNSPGGDIYIHGSCETIGCIPLTDDKIKELYLLAIFSTDLKTKKIPVNIYPFKMTEENMKKYAIQFPAHVDFWKTLQLGYLAFEKDKNALKFKEAKGKYVVK